MQARTIRSVIEGQTLLTTTPGMRVVDAARLMRDRRVGAILVVDGGRLAGIFTERDALFRVLADARSPETTMVADVMTRNPKTIAPDRLFTSALEIMHQGRFRHVPVVEDGKPIGIVSARDAMGEELEQFMYSVIIDEQARDVLA